MRKLFSMALPLVLVWCLVAAGEIYKNKAGQNIALFARDMKTGLPKTGDAANLTAYVSKAGGAVAALGDTSAAELSADYAPGWYLWDLAQAETNAETLLVTAMSSTSDVNVAGAYIVTRAYTVDANGLMTTVTHDVSVAAGIADTDDMEDAVAAALTAQGLTTARAAYLDMLPGLTGASWMHETTVATATDAKTFTLTAGPDTDGWFGRREWLCLVKDADGATPTIPAGETVLTYTASTKTVVLAAALPFTPEASDVVVLVPIAWGRPAGGRVGAPR